MRGQGSELERRRTGYAENPRNCTFSMGGTLRGRFELPRAFRPTRSQVWRVRPGFATSAASPLSESGNTLSRSSAGGSKRPHVQLEGDHRLDERVGLEDPGMDLAEPTDLAALDEHGCGPARDVVSILHRGGVSTGSLADAIVSDMTSWYPYPMRRTRSASVNSFSGKAWPIV